MFGTVSLCPSTNLCFFSQSFRSKIWGEIFSHTIDKTLYLLEKPLSVTHTVQWICVLNVMCKHWFSNQIVIFVIVVLLTPHKLTIFIFLLLTKHITCSFNIAVEFLCRSCCLKSILLCYVKILHIICLFLYTRTCLFDVKLYLSLIIDHFVNSSVRQSDNGCLWSSHLPVWQYFSWE